MDGPLWKIAEEIAGYLRTHGSSTRNEICEHFSMRKRVCDIAIAWLAWKGRLEFEWQGYAELVRLREEN